MPPAAGTYQHCRCARPWVYGKWSERLHRLAVPRPPSRGESDALTEETAGVVTST